METHDIATWFLILGLFVPRLTLFFGWLCNALPYNTTPFFGDVIATIFLPRVLILIYIYQNWGACGWFWLHLFAFAVACVYNICTWESNMEKLKRAGKWN